MEHLRQRCLADFGDESIWTRIAAAYSAPPRVYHSLAHLPPLFAHYDRLRGGFTRPRAVMIAIWFHDFVYETDRENYPENEVRSAAAMHALLSAREHPEDLRLVDVMIRASAAHRAVPADFARAPGAICDCELFLDIDLSVLGESDSEIDAYDAAVRQEFAQVPEAEFAAARVGVLEALLSRDRIYFSTPFASREERARTNLRRLIERWRSLVPDRRR